jgi:hypothetical protein
MIPPNLSDLIVARAHHAQVLIRGRSAGRL